MFKFLRNHRSFTLLLFDILCYIFIALVCFLVSFADPGVFISTPMIDPAAEAGNAHFFTNVIILGIMIFAFRLMFGFYKNVWRYTYTKAYLGAIIQDASATIITVFIAFFVRWGISGKPDFKIWPFVIIAALFCLTTLASRYSYRLVYKYKNRVSDEPSAHKINVAIVGAGQMGALLADELRCSKISSYNPIAFIDKDKTKKGEFIGGIKVYHEDENIVQTVKKLPIQEIFIAMPGLDSEAIEHLYRLYRKTGCKIKIYDTPVRELGKEESQGKKVLREFQIEDLLFRKQLKINNRRSLEFYQNKVVLVTGGGGSIGSELCRQIAKLGPKKLIILDIYENNAYDIQQELLRTYGDKLDLTVFIASIRDEKRLDTIFAQCRPDIVFHAAAHKHVPLMENNPAETIKNNVLGTYNTANAAEKYGVSKFIMVSTDKAVNPTNIMGASKRMCEMIVQCRTDSKTCFSAVRFGNVLGSNGSVIPLFRNQIAKGGPITITDKRIIRYFMTIPEASQLVIQAGAMAQRGELFVLDMGKPVKIYDLAVNMIKLSGLVPEEDIKIEEVGLRPGEKLYEELLIKTETMGKTDNDMIFIETDTPYTREEVDEKIEMLRAVVIETADELASKKVVDAMKKAVPTFKDPNEINVNAEKSNEMKEAAN